MKLNSDLGESFSVYQMPNEKQIMKHIDMANIACGFHAGDPLNLQKSVSMAVHYGLEIGAHPSYPDLVGFGRRSMKCSHDEIEAFVIYQCGALNAIALANGGRISYVKPHGGLYNDMMRDEAVLSAILSAIAKYDNTLPLMILSTSKNAHFEKKAKQYGVKLLYEAFADRAYTNEGFLLPRSQKGAVLHKKDDVLKRVKMLVQKGIIESIDGKKLPLKVDALCVHGDNKEALELVKAIKKSIK